MEMQFFLRVVVYFVLEKGIATVVQQQLQGNEVPVLGGHVHGRLSVVRCQVGTGTGLEQHQSAAIAIFHPGGDV